MPKSLKKVQEHIARRKGKAAVLHEKSRDSKILQRASVREGRIAKQVSGRSSIVRPFCTQHIQPSSVSCVG